MEPIFVRQVIVAVGNIAVHSSVVDVLGGMVDEAFLTPI